MLDYWITDLFISAVLPIRKTPHVELRLDPKRERVFVMHPYSNLILSSLLAPNRADDGDEKESTFRPPTLVSPRAPRMQEDTTLSIFAFWSQVVQLE